MAGFAAWREENSYAKTEKEEGDESPYYEYSSSVKSVSSVDKILWARKAAKTQKKVMNHLTTKVFPSVSHLVRYLRFRLLWVRNEEGDKSPYYEGFRTLCAICVSCG